MILNTHSCEHFLETPDCFRFLDFLFGYHNLGFLRCLWGWETIWNNMSLQEVEQVSLIAEVEVAGGSWPRNQSAG